MADKTQRKIVAQEWENGLWRVDLSAQDLSRIRACMSITEWHRGQMLAMERLPNDHEVIAILDGIALYCTLSLSDSPLLDYRNAMLRRLESMVGE